MNKQSVIFLIVAIIASIFLLGAVPSKPRWEYKEIFSVKQLNEMEEKDEGWSVIGFSVDQSINPHILLKRQKH